MADLSVTVFPVQRDIFKQENNNISQSTYIYTGDNMMLYTLCTKTSHTNYSGQSFITSRFPFADEKKIAVIVTVIMQKRPLSLTVVCKAETISPNRSYSGASETYFGDLL